MYNPTFKRPSAFCQVGRSPSPPRRFVEPLSPVTRSSPLDLHFRYPALDSYAEQNAANATQGNAQRKSRHHRSSSNIATLAEVALATSPSFQTPTPASVGRQQGYSQALGHATGEPPHKRARSELYSSSYGYSDVSRPATSYESLNCTARDVQSRESYESRVEEAALLLNFRTGGWPGPGSSPAVTHIAHGTSFASARPHANSFTQDVPRPNLIQLAPVSPLLPAFNPEAKTLHQAAGHDQAMRSAQRLPKQEAPVVADWKAIPEYGQSLKRLSPTAIDSEVTPDVSMTDVTDAAPVKKRRGWPKGKPRGTGNRKTVAEKAATKKAAARRKAADSRSGKKNASPGSTADESALHRRHSISVIPSHGSTPTEAGSRCSSVPRDIHMIVRPGPAPKPSRRSRASPEVSCAGCATTRDTADVNGDVKDQWISCNGCKLWFHVDCAGFKKASEVRDVDKYFCGPCEPQHGKTTYVRKSSRAHASVDYAELQRGVLKTSEESIEHHYIQPIKDGTFQFDPDPFPRIPPEMVTKDFLERGGFTEPICIPAALNPRPWTENKPYSFTSAVNDGKFDDNMDMMPDDFEYDTVPDVNQDKLDMVMPENLTVRQVCQLVGPDTPLDVIDVKTQNSGGKKWNLKRWADYYEEEEGDKQIRNVISLEVSQSKLGRLLRRPKVVRDIDLQDQVWPAKETELGKWPKVQFYCLMSVADSYTDFHIDFGGSSVYYHILKGQKTFFFIPPKPKHLKAYEEWNDSPEQNYTFLPDITKECYRVDLGPGDTMLIPSGWIHAVWTPATSLVIGGNFLTRMSYRNQFKVYEIEKANNTPLKFRYPFFMRLMWYTAIQYLEQDPLPQEVSQLFLEGKRFERDIPIWADFDGDLADEDSRPGAKNHRYYSQAELDGLPDLVNFIFRSVMLVMGRVEGVSADQMKRVNSSIPKGNGEPLDLAKSFALWVAWKRGNEDPPAWAHPDAVLPNKKEEGPPKKLSARALKEMERKEAIAAWRIVPDRQSARVKNAAATAASAGNSATPAPLDTTAPPITTSSSLQGLGKSQEHHHYHQPPQTTSPSSPHHRVIHQQPSQPYHTFTATTSPLRAPSQSPVMAQSMPYVMPAMPGQYLSTPKTSVLGPKRVACDACRRRRIRCKHKDLVMEITDPNHVSPVWQATPTSAAADSSSVAAASAVAADAEAVEDAIAATSPEMADVLNDTIQVSPLRTMRHGSSHGYSPDAGPLPGTNAYVTANIPMTMNGVPIFGDALKRGRSKACVECRKSKRRCIHDENGQVDPVKAAETPVPRGSNASKKRSPGQNDSPTQPKIPARSSFGANEHSRQSVFHQHDQEVDSAMQRLSEALGRHAPQPQQEVHQSQLPIDPSLAALYSDPSTSGLYSHEFPSYSVSGTQPQFNMQSLEEIASEVLDMNGHQDEGFPRNEKVSVSHEEYHGLPTPCDDGNKPDGSVDSAISISAASADARTPPSEPSPAVMIPTDEAGSEAGVQLSVELAITADEKGPASSLPLYQPPAPPSTISPELQKRQPILSGVGVVEPHTPQQSQQKRKRDSHSHNSSRPGSVKKHQPAVLASATDEATDGAPTTEDQASLELAKALQQDDLGLRRRGK